MNKIPRVGFFQSSIGVTVGKILIHLGRYLKRHFPIIYTRYVKLVKPFVSFEEYERRLWLKRRWFSNFMPYRSKEEVFRLWDLPGDREKTSVELHTET